MLSWLGAPKVTGRRRVVAAMAIDSLGEGMFMPFFVVFFINVAGLPASQVGLACTIGAVLALPAGPVVGRLVDNAGPVPVIVVANVIRAVACASFLVVGNFAGVLIVNAVSLCAGEAFWTANSVFISQMADPTEQRRWFAFQRSLRNVGIGAGALTTALILAVAERSDSYIAFLIANSVSYVAAAALVWNWSRARPQAATDKQDKPVDKSKGWLREALADRTFRSLSLTNVLYVIGGMAPALLWTYHAVDISHAPSWLPGVLFGINTAIAAGMQLPVNKLAERASPVVSLYGALIGWGLSFALLAVVMSGTWIDVTTGFLVAVLIYSFGEILFGATLGALTVRAAPEHLRGRYMGLYQLSWTLSSIVAPATLVTMSGASPIIPWIALTVVVAATVIPVRNLRHVDMGVSA